MIITIDDGNFSNANNGTIDTVPIKKIIGKGANHSIQNFITIGETANWSITLDTSKADNFTEYLIKMGDDVITPTIDENIMTINISDVNKPIFIYVKTNNIENAAEE